MKRSRQSKHMKKVRALMVGLVLGVAMQVCAADALTEALQKGLFEEEANQNLEAAIKAYQDVLGRADEQRRVAATALFRLAECYRKQGKTNEASAEYRRIGSRLFRPGDAGQPQPPKSGGPRRHRDGRLNYSGLSETRPPDHRRRTAGNPAHPCAHQKQS